MNNCTQLIAKLGRATGQRVSQLNYDFIHESNGIERLYQRIVSMFEDISKDPGHFGMTETDMHRSEEFILKAGKYVKQISEARSKRGATKRRGRGATVAIGKETEETSVMSTRQILDETKEAYDEGDEMISVLSDSMKGIKEMAKGIGNSLEESTQKIIDITTEVENAEAHANVATRKIEKVSNMAKYGTKGLMVANVLAIIGLIVVIIIKVKE
ncbi:hypothetical protein ADUPG1_009642 [Aduncisulcus paluster]|uniref:t-SNARE coiled-coil homology domain-containing protein n=1 Tax=Aduncisulcus paluster TaxID=2918883 RepID=A0ABQ5KWB5_9EUKA|nr:hypothetical protein ADUPG1_009642 [Aduncisulcus paluster]